MTAASVEISTLARRLGRLAPHWRDPHRYFEDRDEIERALKRIARQLEGATNG